MRACSMLSSDSDSFYPCSDLSIASNGATETKSLKNGGASSLWQSCANLPIQRLTLILEHHAKVDASIFDSLREARKWCS